MNHPMDEWMNERDKGRRAVNVIKAGATFFNLPLCFLSCSECRPAVGRCRLPFPATEELLQGLSLSFIQGTGFAAAAVTFV